MTPIELARRIVAAGAWAGRSPVRWGAGGAATRGEAVNELRRAVAALPALDGTDRPGDVSDLWNRRRRELRRHAVTRNPEAFLTWTPIVRSMTFGLLSCVREELRALRRSGEWERRWRDAVRENRSGLPMPSHFLPASSGTLLHHAYHLHRFEVATGRTVGELAEIVEFGGGYGSMARLAARLGFRGRYHVHDLPELSALQRFYLRSVGAEVGAGDVADTLSRVTFSARQDDASPAEERAGGALFLATWSLAETPLRLRQAWRPTLARFRHFLFGFRDRFEEIDNLAWFEELAASRPDVRWRWEPIRHRREGLRYLFGSPSPGRCGVDAVPDLGSTS